MKTILTALSFLLLGNFVFAAPSDPEVVPAVDLSAYAGKWYEIAHSKNFFQRNCTRSTADYAVIDESSISVHNICYQNNGKITDIKGVATITDSAVPAKLKVKFSFFQRGDYWIVDLDPNYQWAVVSAPKKKSLFILARQAPMNEKLLAELLSRLKSRGFDTEKLVFDVY